MPDLADGWMDRVTDALAALAPGEQPRRDRASGRPGAGAGAGRAAEKSACGVAVLGSRLCGASRP
eukprot:5632073-Prymnesium_polylepis.1